MTGDIDVSFERKPIPPACNSKPMAGTTPRRTYGRTFALSCPLRAMYTTAFMAILGFHRKFSRFCGYLLYAMFNAFKGTMTTILVQASGYTCELAVMDLACTYRHTRRITVLCCICFRKDIHSAPQSGTTCVVSFNSTITSSCVRRVQTGASSAIHGF